MCKNGKMSHFLHSSGWWMSKEWSCLCLFKWSWTDFRCPEIPQLWYHDSLLGKKRTTRHPCIWPGCKIYLQIYSTQLYIGRAGCGNGLNGPWSRFVKRMGRSEGELLWTYNHSWIGFSCSWPGRQQSFPNHDQPFKSQLRNLIRWTVA